MLMLGKDVHTITSIWNQISFLISPLQTWVWNTTVYSTVLWLPLVLCYRSCSRREPSGWQTCSSRPRRSWKAWGRLLWPDTRSRPGFLPLTEVWPHRATTARCRPQTSKLRTLVCTELLSLNFRYIIICLDSSLLEDEMVFSCQGQKEICGKSFF